MITNKRGEIMTYLEAGIEVLKLIEMNGYEAFFVGGFVRDYILGIESNDIDITTNALPSEIANIFKVVNTGIKYNSITIVYEGYYFETTTYRIEGAYLDNRHPIYTVGKTLLDDLRRRDFTVNAMAMDKNLQIIDVFGGLDDLKNKIIKTVNEPQKRFTEDALRMLRAAYFASKLEFIIEPNTLNAMRKCGHLVQNLSCDRISWELEKMIKTNNSKCGVKYLIESNIAPYLFEFKNGIYLIQEKHIENLSWEEFLVIAFFEKPDELYKIHLKSDLNELILSAIKLAKKNPKNNYSNIDLFEYGLEVTKLANFCNVLILKSKDYSEQLPIDFQELPIKSISDLAIRGYDILENVKIDDNRLIGQILDEIKKLILLKKLENTKECIIKYIRKNF